MSITIQRINAMWTKTTYIIATILGTLYAVLATFIANNRVEFVVFAFAGAMIGCILTSIIHDAFIGGGK